MAYTKIIAIRNRLDRCINYALNEKKTELQSAIGYAFNAEKTHIAFESSINCLRSTAVKEMQETKRRYGKTGGVQGYHIIQSFKPGEIDAELAHKLGCEFTESTFGGRFEMIIATHLDRNHLHNHIVLNSVSLKDGKKLRGNFHDYFETIRGESDRLCEHYGLSVISPDIENRTLTYFEWLALYKGRASWNTIIKNDIDAAVSNAPSYGAFLVLMEHQGYEVKQGKYLAFRPMGKERFSRGYKLGKEYSFDAIKARIEGNEFLEELPVSYTPKRRQNINLPMPNVLRIYWRYTYLLGNVKKHQAPTRMSAYLKQELLKFEDYKSQFKFIQSHSLNSIADINTFITARQHTINHLYEQLSKVKAQYQSKNVLFSALTKVSKYRRAHQLFQSGYTLMREESDIYLKADAVLQKHGYIDKNTLGALLEEKLSLTHDMDTIKSKVRGLNQDIKRCERILDSVKTIKHNMEQKQENMKRIERQGEYIDRH